MPGEKNNLSSSINIEGNVTVEKNVIAEAFNHYFVETISRLSDLVSSTFVDVINEVLPLKKYSKLLYTNSFVNLKRAKLWDLTRFLPV